jgi:hypothetical protein
LAVPFFAGIGVYVWPETRLKAQKCPPTGRYAENIEISGAFFLFITLLINELRRFFSLLFLAVLYKQVASRSNFFARFKK